MPVFLVSDFLWWLILIFLAISVYRLKNFPQTKRKWKNVFSQPLAMVCAVIFFFYMLIASVDSIHFKNSDVNRFDTPVISVLDLLLEDFSVEKEKTYSKPFSANLHSKITVTENGISKRVSLPLKRINTGRDGTISSNQTGDLMIERILKGMLMALVLASFLLGIIHYLTRRWDWNSRIAAYLTIVIIIGLLCVLYSLSKSFYVFGTDKVGNDVLIDVIKGVRTAMLLGILTTVVLLPLALISGISAGYFGGFLDDVIQFIYTTINSIPSILLIASAVLLLQVVMERNANWFTLNSVRVDVRFMLLCSILGLTSWTGLCRLLRAETLKIRSLEYVQAARSLGVSQIKLLTQHILPNVMHIVLIVVVLDFSGLILAEAVLSYVGIGVDATMPSWGNMINNARMEIAQEPPVWWILTATFVFMFVLVLAANLFADVVRQVFDPRQSKGVISN